MVRFCVRSNKSRRGTSTPSPCTPASELRVVRVVVSTRCAWFVVLGLQARTCVCRRVCNCCPHEPTPRPAACPACRRIMPPPRVVEKAIGEKRVSRELAIWVLHCRSCGHRRLHCRPASSQPHAAACLCACQACRPPAVHCPLTAGDCARACGHLCVPRAGRCCYK